MALETIHTNDIKIPRAGGWYTSTITDEQHIPRPTGLLNTTEIQTLITENVMVVGENTSLALQSKLNKQYEAPTTLSQASDAVVDIQQNDDYVFTLEASDTDTFISYIDSTGNREVKSLGLLSVGVSFRVDSEYLVLLHLDTNTVYVYDVDNITGLTPITPLFITVLGFVPNANFTFNSTALYVVTDSGQIANVDLATGTAVLSGFPGLISGRLHYVNDYVYGVLDYSDRDNANGFHIVKLDTDLNIALETTLDPDVMGRSDVDYGFAVNSDIIAIGRPHTDNTSGYVTVLATHDLSVSHTFVKNDTYTTYGDFIFLSRNQLWIANHTVNLTTAVLDKHNSTTLELVESIPFELVNSFLLLGVVDTTIVHYPNDGVEDILTVMLRGVVKDYMGAKDVVALTETKQHAIREDTILHIETTGTDYLGNEVLPEPFATLQGALDFIADKAIVDCTVTIQLGIMDVTINEPIIFYHQNGNNVYITGHGLRADMSPITGIKYVTGTSPYDPVIDIDKFKYTGNKLTDGEFNKNLYMERYGTVINIPPEITAQGFLTVTGVLGGIGGLMFNSANKNYAITSKDSRLTLNDGLVFQSMVTAGYVIGAELTNSFCTYDGNIFVLHYSCGFQLFQSTLTDANIFTNAHGAAEPYRIYSADHYFFISAANNSLIFIALEQVHSIFGAVIVDGTYFWVRYKNSTPSSAMGVFNATAQIVVKSWSEITGFGKMFSSNGYDGIIRLFFLDTAPLIDQLDSVDLSTMNDDIGRVYINCSYKPNITYFEDLFEFGVIYNDNNFIENGRAYVSNIPYQQAVRTYTLPTHQPDLNRIPNFIYELTEDFTLGNMLGTTIGAKGTITFKQDVIGGHLVDMSPVGSYYTGDVDTMSTILGNGLGSLEVTMFNFRVIEVDLIYIEYVNTTQGT